MMASRRQAIAAALTLGAASAVAAAWRPRLHAADTLPKIDLDKLFPTQFGSWRFDPRVLAPIVSPDVAALLNRLYNQTLSRTYLNEANDRIMLSVAYGGDQSDATRAHRPEVCYPAQGFEVKSIRTAVIDIGRDRQLPVRQLQTRLGARVEPVTYWILVGEHVAISGTQQKLLQLRYTTRGVIPDGLLVRVSSIDPRAERAFGIHQQFIRQLFSAVSVESQARLFGAAIV